MNIQLKKQGKMISAGHCDLQTGVYYSHRLDRMYKFNGFAISKCIIEWLHTKQVHTIVVSGLTTNPKMYLNSGTQWFDEGEEQLVLNVGLFDGGSMCGSVTYIETYQTTHQYEEKQEKLW